MSETFVKQKLAVFLAREASSPIFLGYVAREIRDEVACVGDPSKGTRLRKLKVTTLSHGNDYVVVQHLGVWRHNGSWSTQNVAAVVIQSPSERPHDLEVSDEISW